MWQTMQKQAAESTKQNFVARRPPAPRAAIGNQAYLRQLEISPPQARLVIGAVNDPLERDADRIADAVTRGPVNLPAAALAAQQAHVQRKCAACEEDLVARKPAAAAVPAAAVAPPAIHAVLSASGRPMDAPTRGFFESRFGRSFAGVRVHTDAMAAGSARMIGARAYTVRDRIVFSDGQYNPATAEGRWLIAHELAHVGQQAGAAALPEAVRRAPFDLAGADADSCKAKIAEDTAACADKVNTACSVLGVLTAGEGAIAGGLAGSFFPGAGNIIGAGIGTIVGGVAGAISYGKCVERMNKKCRDRGNAASAACDKKFSAPAAADTQIPVVNVEDLPKAPIPTANVEDLPQAQ